MRLLPADGIGIIDCRDRLLSCQRGGDCRSAPAYKEQMTITRVALVRAGVSMRIGMDFGLDRIEFEVADDQLIPGPQPPAALADAAAAVRAALEQPHAFPALR